MVEKITMPDWFNEADYDEFKGFSDKKLLSQLKKRRFAYYLVRRPDVDELLRSVVEGFYTNGAIWDENITSGMIMPLDEEPKKYTIDLVRDMGSYELFSMAREIDSYIALDDRIGRIPERELSKLISTPERAYIGVNLEGRLDDIKAAFSKWLEIRHVQPEPVAKETTDTIKQKIIQYKVIPYLDLRLWAELIETQLTREDFVKILCREEISYQSVQRKIEKYAGIALSTSFLSSLTSEP